MSTRLFIKQNFYFHNGVLGLQLIFASLLFPLFPLLSSSFHFVVSIFHNRCLGAASQPLLQTQFRWLGSRYLFCCNRYYHQSIWWTSSQVRNSQPWFFFSLYCRRHIPFNKVFTYLFENNIHHLYIEGDILVVINPVKGIWSLPWQIAHIIQNIQFSLRGLFVIFTRKQIKQQIKSSIWNT